MVVMGSWTYICCTGGDVRHLFGCPSLRWGYSPQGTRHSSEWSNSKPLPSLCRAESCVFFWQASILAESQLYGNCYRKNSSWGACREPLLTGCWLEKELHLLVRCPGTSHLFSGIFRAKARDLDPAYRWAVVVTYCVFFLYFLGLRCIGLKKCAHPWSECIFMPKTMCD